MNTVPWRENDALFKRELQKGYRWQVHVADRFAALGCEVTVPKLEIRRDISEADRFLNVPDLVVNDRHIEVKSSSRAFTSPETFPFSRVFVDTVSGYDAKDPKPFAYVLVSQQTGVMLAIRATSPDGWEIDTQRDKVRDIVERFYVTTRAKLRPFSALLAALQRGF